MTEQPYTLPPGTQFDNFQIQQVLGVGGFGITYKAIDMSLACQVAIKEYFPIHLAVRSPNTFQIQPKTRADTTMYETGLQRFMDEARLLARFTDPYIVRVRRFIEDNGSAYIIMDYEEGLPLSRYLMRSSTLNEMELKLIFQPVLKGLRTLHTMNVLHRDIKPPNIYLRSGGSPILLDFGAARQAVNMQDREIMKLGTHYYAPYEQFTSSEPQGPWTDIYSVGATLYHCLTGQPPTPSLDRISAAHAGRRDPQLPTILASKDRYSPELLACVDWMLQLRASDRPQSNDELIPLFDNAGDPVSTGTVLSKNDMDWDAELICRAEQLLSEHLGHPADILVRQTVSRVYTVEDLYHALSEHIESAVARERFIKAVNTIAPTTSTLNRRYHATTTPLAMPSPDSTSTSPARPLDETLIEKLIQQLAYHIGPMSRLLVRQAVEANYDLEQIVDILARELPDKAERERFRKQFAVT